MIFYLKLRFSSISRGIFELEPQSFCILKIQNQLQIRNKSPIIRIIVNKQQTVRQIYNNLNMYGSSQKQQKRNQFRNQIRRKQIQQYFNTQRIKFAEKQIIEEQQQILKELDSTDKKKQWVRNRRMQLGNIPQKEWFSILRTISISVKCFSNGDFSDWIEAGLIQCLVQTFKQQYKSLQLSKISACILQDVFYYLPAEGPQVQRILQYEFILDLIQLCADQETSCQYYYQLIITIIQQRVYLRNTFIDNGLVQILANRLKYYTTYDSDQVFCALSLAYRLVKMYNIAGVQHLPKGNVISIFIPIFDTYLTLTKNQDSLRVLLKSFSSLANSQKQYILNHLFASQNLINFVLHLITIQGNPFNRSAAASILASILSSEKLSYSQQLLRRGILENLLICSKMHNNQHQCITFMLQIISNISANSLDQARTVINHEVFDNFVITNAKQTSNLKNHQNAIFIICSIIQYNNFQLTQLMLKKYQILQIFVQSLNHETPPISNCLQVLRALTNLIKMYDQIYTGDQNRITLDLQRYFNINNVLTGLQERVNSKKIHSYVQILFSAMNGV